MQHNITQKNKSNVIKQTEESQKKAKRRLIGSIFLLLVALVVLLNVTAKMKPVAVEPNTVQIKNTAIINSSAPVIAKQIASEPLLTQNNAVAANATTPNDSLASTKDNSSGGYKAKIESINNQVGTATETRAATKKLATVNASQPQRVYADHLFFTPQVVAITVKHQASPEDILNGNTTNDDTPKQKYYVQLTASHDKSKLMGIKQALGSKGVQATVQAVTISDGTTVYRLRMGPFSSRELAQKNMAKLQSAD